MKLNLNRISRLGGLSSSAFPVTPEKTKQERPPLKPTGSFFFFDETSV